MKYKDILPALKKNLILVIGSLLLVSAWFFEKITINNYEENIAKGRRQLLEYELFIHDSRLTTLVTKVDKWAYSNDSSYENKKKLKESLLNQALSYELLVANGKLGSEDVIDTTAKKIQDDYYEKVALYKSYSVDSLLMVLKVQEAHYTKDIFNYQTDISNKIVSNKKKLDKWHFGYLIFYAIGIIIISVDRGMKEINKEKSDQVLLTTMRQIIHKKKD
jgi:hypothetical protein